MASHQLGIVLATATAIALPLGLYTAFSPAAPSSTASFEALSGGYPCTGVLEVPASGESGSEDVFLIDDCDRRPLVDSPADEYAPSLSPDGASVAFVRRTVDDAPTELVVSDVATGAEKVVVTHPFPLGDPQWSPDGGNLAFWRDDGTGRPNIYTLELAQRRLQQITSDDAVEVQPAWSPDGTALALTRADAAGSRIVVHDLTTGIERVLTPSGAPFEHPTWAPDGQRMAAATGEAPEVAVVVLNASTGAVLSRTGDLAGDVAALSWAAAGVLATVPGGSVRGAADTVVVDPASGQQGDVRRTSGVPAWAPPAAN